MAFSIKERHEAFLKEIRLPLHNSLTQRNNKGSADYDIQTVEEVPPTGYDMDFDELISELMEDD